MIINYSRHECANAYASSLKPGDMIAFMRDCIRCDEQNIFAHDPLLIMSISRCTDYSGWQKHRPNCCCMTHFLDEWDIRLLNSNGTIIDIIQFNLLEYSYIFDGKNTMTAIEENRGCDRKKS